MSHEDYWVKRGQKKFQADSWDTLCQWAREGRLKLSDEYKTPESHQWRSIQREPVLSSLMPERERLILKRGEASYRAPNYELIQEWAKRGQVSPEDMVYSSYTQLWTPVSELGTIMKCIPDAVMAKLAQKKERRRDLEMALEPQEKNLTRDTDSPKKDVSTESQEKNVKLEPDSPKKDVSILELNNDEDKDTDAMIPILKPSAEIIKEICAPIYDTARLFIVIKDLRPLDRIKGECLLKSMKLDCQGMSKQEAFASLIEGLKKHQQFYLGNEVSARSLGAEAIYDQLNGFIKCTEQRQHVIGKRAEERFVVGNQNRPKMTSEEASLMINLQTAVEQMIQAVRAFKQ
ncbi:MAG: hypothetical protein CMH49_09170 [Myxococcales bacterium]|nr:hypothetical protein [Myxococcales bacterium]